MIAPASPPLQITNLSAFHDNGILFQNANFSCDKGDLVLVRGENGAGKTTLLKLLAGLRRADAGKVEFAGRYAWLGHKDGLKPSLSAREMLGFYAKWYGLTGDIASQINDALTHFHLTEKADLPLFVLSQGQRKRVALAGFCLQTHADLWLMDEPLASLDKASITDFGAMIKAYIDKGGIAIIASHDKLPIPPCAVIEMGPTPIYQKGAGA